MKRISLLCIVILVVVAGSIVGYFAYATPQNNETYYLSLLSISSLLSGRKYKYHIIDLIHLV